LDEVIARLKERAARNGRSLRTELHSLAERAPTADIVEGRALAARIRRKLRGRKYSDSAALVADDRRR
jgi:plasmid stability protein